jgi:hypothetical protein
MTVRYLIYLAAQEIPVDKELYYKFDRHRGYRSHAQTMRDIMCTALGVQLSKIDLSYGHIQKINTMIELTLEKERSKRGISKRETIRQLVSEQLSEVN